MCATSRTRAYQLVHGQACVPRLLDALSNPASYDTCKEIRAREHATQEGMQPSTRASEHAHMSVHMCTMRTHKHTDTQTLVRMYILLCNNHTRMHTRTHARTEVWSHVVTAIHAGTCTHTSAHMHTFTDFLHVHARPRSSECRLLPTTIARMCTRTCAWRLPSFSGHLHACTCVHT